MRVSCEMTITRAVVGAVAAVGRPGAAPDHVVGEEDALAGVARDGGLGDRALVLVGDALDPIVRPPVHDRALLEVIAPVAREIVPRAGMEQILPEIVGEPDAVSRLQAGDGFRRKLDGRDGAVDGAPMLLQLLVRLHVAGPARSGDPVRIPPLRAVGKATRSRSGPPPEIAILTRAATGVALISLSD